MMLITYALITGKIEPSAIGIRHVLAEVDMGTTSMANSIKNNHSYYNKNNNCNNNKNNNDTNNNNNHINND